MGGKRIVNLLIFICSVIICAISWLYLDGYLKWISGGSSAVLATVFLILAIRMPTLTEPQTRKTEAGVLAKGITEAALLNEHDNVIATWEMYGKTSLVVGRDVGENQVSINLNQAAFAGMIDREHAVLNYTGGQWYVEDLGSKNGVSVRKPDGKKYRLSPDQPCLLEIGDILYIAMTKLLFQ